MLLFFVIVQLNLLTIYRFRWLLQQVEAGHLVQDLKMTVLQAIQYIIKAWKETSVETISNCWRHTKILPANSNPSDNIRRRRTDDPVTNELSETINALGLSAAMEVEEFLTFPDENIVYEIPKDNRELANLFATDNLTGEDVFGTENLDEDDSIEVSVITASTALRSLENVKMFLLQQADTSEQIRLVGILEKFIEEKKVGQLQQTYIDEYFAINLT